MKLSDDLITDVANLHDILRMRGNSIGINSRELDALDILKRVLDEVLPAPKPLSKEVLDAMKEVERLTGD